MRFVFFIIFIGITCLAWGAQVDTVTIASKAMKRSYQCIVIKPANYPVGGKAFETVYLLHGHGGSFSNWYNRVPTLASYASKYNLIIVCPEGKTAGWYLDSPMADSMQFETYIGTEVPAFIDAHYNTVKSRKGRAITGLSMGGHGGLTIGMKHLDNFGACGSMSGALLLSMITDKRYGVDKLLGDTSHKDIYFQHSVMALLEKLPKDTLAIIIDCGTEDFIVEMSRLVHAKMLELHIPHDYIERPGKHEWKYWANAVEYQLLFFRKYFDSKH
ncbi:MAG: alpha/beta hydrolase family protein [Ferruginibacter sp.]